MSYTLRDLILHGAPWEVLPEDRARVLAAARRLVGDPSVSREHRAYIERVWLTEPEPEPEQLSTPLGDSEGAPMKAPTPTADLAHATGDTPTRQPCHCVLCEPFGPPLTGANDDAGGGER